MTSHFYFSARLWTKEGYIVPWTCTVCVLSVCLYVRDGWRGRGVMRNEFAVDFLVHFFKLTRAIDVICCC